MVPSDELIITATCLTVTVTSASGIDSVVLTLSNGSTATYVGGQLNQLFSSIDRVRGEVVAGSFDTAALPGLVQVVATSGSLTRSATLPTDCGGIAPLPPVPSETPETPPPDRPDGPDGPDRPDRPDQPDGEPPAPVPGERPPVPGEPTPPRIVSGPPTDRGPDELPATGTDVPTRLLLGVLTLLLGFALLRMSPATPASDPATLNGFRRTPGPRPGTPRDS